MQRADHALLIGFGGPERPEEVRPFLEQFTRGTRIPEERLREVEFHYRVTGGFSPYNSHARRLFGKLKEQLEIPLFLGMRNWKPFLADTLRGIVDRGLRSGLAVVLAPHRSEASFGRYLESLQSAVREAGVPVEYRTLPPWHDHPGFVGAQAQRIRPLWGDGAGKHLLFTAHSIPLEIAKASSYVEEIEASGRAVAGVVGAARWSVAYQSRSGPPGQPWLEPDIRAEIRRLKTDGVRAIVAAPVGFLFDHTEVLYDLDVEAKQVAGQEGLLFLRAPTVMDHPQFVRMFAELIQKQVQLVPGTGVPGTTGAER